MKNLKTSKKAKLKRIIHDELDTIPMIVVIVVNGSDDYFADTASMEYDSDQSQYNLGLSQRHNFESLGDNSEDEEISR